MHSWKIRPRMSGCPKNRLSDKWKHTSDPAFRLRVALCGPHSGSYWETCSFDMLAALGWKQISTVAWRSVFWHPIEKVMLILCVDNFRMAGPGKALQKLWSAIRSHIELSDPASPGKFLGCDCNLQTQHHPSGNRSFISALTHIVSLRMYQVLP